MVNKYGHILSYIATNQETAVVINIDGEIVDAIRLDFDPAVPPLLEQFLKEVEKKHPRCAVRLLPRENMSDSKLQQKIDEAVEALKLNEGGKLKPGANIVK